MINACNLFIYEYTQQESSLRWLTCNGDFDWAEGALKEFQKEFRRHFSEALKIREEHIISMMDAIKRERENSPESHSEFYDMLLSNIVSTIPVAVTEAEESDLPF